MWGSGPGEDMVTGGLLVPLDRCLDGHVAIELGVLDVGRPAGLHELREDRERDVREEDVERLLHGLGPLLDVRGAVLVVVGLDVDDDIDVEALGDDHRDELDGAGRKRPQLAVEAGGDDLLAGVLEQLERCRMLGRDREALVEVRHDVSADHGHGLLPFLGGCRVRAISRVDRKSLRSL